MNGYPPTKFKLGDIIHSATERHRPTMKILSVIFGIDGDVGYAISGWAGVERGWLRQTVMEHELHDWMVANA